ncbi:CAP domain-containing protein [Streptomyces sp. NPDC002122]|uniref:CAP domain-containing protein n=1 Tax=Streptomyces sp. NPDC002122 TaxID=3154407 RepID=UPI003331F9D2
MRHHDHPGHPENPEHAQDGEHVQREEREEHVLRLGRPVRADGRHRKGRWARRGAPRRPGFRAAVTAAGAAAVVLTVAAGVYVASPAPAVGSPTAAAPATAAAGAETDAAGGKVAEYVQQVVALANAEREKAGCGPVRAETHLRTAAQRHSDDMAARDYYEHDTPEGRDAGDRMTGAGYTWSTWGENIHRGPKTPALAMEDWMDSPGHRENILNCSFKDIGVGVTLTANGPWWVQDFGAKG